jgi:hypothetical protein
MRLTLYFQNGTQGKYAVSLACNGLLNTCSGKKTICMYITFIK